MRPPVTTITATFAMSAILSMLGAAQAEAHLVMRFKVLELEDGGGLPPDQPPDQPPGAPDLVELREDYGACNDPGGITDLAETKLDLALSGWTANFMTPLGDRGKTGPGSWCDPALTSIHAFNSMVGWFDLSSSGLPRALSALTQVEEVGISETLLPEDVDLSMLAGMVSLETLEARRNAWGGLTDFTPLTHLPDFENLYLNPTGGTPFAQAQIDAIASMTALRNIYITDSLWQAGVDFSGWASLEALASLDLMRHTFPEIPGEDVPTLCAALRHLQSFNFIVFNDAVVSGSNTDGICRWPGGSPGGNNGTDPN